MEAPSGLYGFGLPFVIILSLLVFVHEFGHYIVARWCRVRVEVFSIGFGPEIFGWTDRAGTRWKFSIIPLGGYVKMFGDADAASRPDGTLELTEEEKKVAFPEKSLAQRTAVVAAGPGINFLFAIILFAGLFMFLGKPITPPVVGGIIEGSAADIAGIELGDRILVVEGRAIEEFRDLQQIISQSAGETLSVEVLRASGQQEVLTVTPQEVVTTDMFGNEHRIGRLGIQSQTIEVKTLAPHEAIVAAVVETWDLTFIIIDGVGQIITGRISFEELGGPLRIAQMSGQVAEIGIITTINFIALLSINLGLINLFPIPILDGGHLLFYAIEALRGRPLGEKAQEYGFRIGFALVLTLIVAVTWNDLIRIDVMEFVKSLIG